MLQHLSPAECVALVGDIVEPLGPGVLLGDVRH